MHAAFQDSQDCLTESGYDSWHLVSMGQVPWLAFSRAQTSSSLFECHWDIS